MADEHDRLVDAAIALDGRLVKKQEKAGSIDSDDTEDMTAVPDMRDIAASRNETARTTDEGRL